MVGDARSAATEHPNVGIPPSAGSKITAPLDPERRSAIAAPATAQEQPAATLPWSRALVVDADSNAGRKPFKPRIEPSSPPLPQPLKQNADGVIDLSSDPLHEGIHRGAPARLRPSIGRVGAEPARRAGIEPMTDAEL